MLSLMLEQTNANFKTNHLSSHSALLSSNEQPSSRGREQADLNVSQVRRKLE
jgi:hypothetical protein